MICVLYVVTVPYMSEADAGVIDTVRRLHDPQVTMVGPHVSLVFAQPIPASIAQAHVRQVAESLRPCEVIFRRAMPWWTGKGPAYVFLLPEEGLSTLGHWHDALHAYDSPFAAAQKLDIPFVPHITLGAVANESAARAIAAQWNASGVVIQAAFDSLLLGRLDATIPRFDLLANVPVGPPT